MADLQGGFSDRVKAILVSSSFILALLGWAFSLGVAYARVDRVEQITADLKNTDKEQAEEISNIQQQLVKLETVATGINQTLIDIKNEVIRLREERK